LDLQGSTSALTPLDQPPTGPLSQDSRSPLKLADGGYYRGADPTSPQVGDVRIRFEIVNAKAVSTVGVQTGDTFAAYQARAGGSVLLVEAGNHGAAEMFKAAQDANKTLTWVLRAVGLAIMFFGLLPTGPRWRRPWSTHRPRPWQDTRGGRGAATARQDLTGECARSAHGAAAGTQDAIAVPSETTPKGSRGPAAESRSPGRRRAARRIPIPEMALESMSDSSCAAGASLSAPGTPLLRPRPGEAVVRSSLGRTLRQVMAGSASPTSLVDEILAGGCLGPIWLRLCAVMAGAAAIYGAVCGSWNGARLSAYVAIKLPLALLLTSAVTVALSWMMAALFGLPLRFGQVLVLTFLALAGSSLLLASLAPVAALFTIAAPAPDQTARTTHNLLYLMHTAFVGACGLAGTRVLWLAMLRLPAPRRRLHAVYLSWVLAYALVGSEVAWALRPFVGSIYQPVVFLRSDALAGNVFEFVFTDILPQLLRSR
jgi:hypothetical protein